MSVGFTTLFLAAFFVHNANAWFFDGKANICHKTGNGNFIAIQVNDSAVSAHFAHGDFPYEGPTNKNHMPTSNAWCNVGPTPTVTPTVAEQPSPTPTPTIQPEDPGCEVDCNEVPTATPTPTGVPCTSNCGTTPDFPHDIQHHANECVGNAPKAPSFRHITRISPTSVKVEIAESDPIDHFIVAYGYVGESLSMGIPYLPSSTTEFVIDGLQPNRHINVQVYAEGSNFCVSDSQTDP